MFIASLFVLNFIVICMSIVFIAVRIMLDINDHDDAFHSFKVFDSNRKVGGIRFLKLGRLNISISISKKQVAL